MEGSKNRFLQGFSLIVIFLAIVRLVFLDRPAEPAVVPALAERPDTISAAPSAMVVERKSPVKHRIMSVPSYATSFPDSNSLQLIYAQRWGTSPVANRVDAESRKADLVYIGSDPYYHVAPLGQSIPYLVPRAASLLHDIGRAFYDSLQIKGIPLHQIVVTSVLRSEADVARLRRRNTNATENSCHRYGTTFDISYVRYKTVEAPGGPARRQVGNDSLKWVLSEVLRDKRNEGRCLIKYERKQPCFHITVKK